MTKDEFEQQYAERSGVTVEWLHERGQKAMPCNCGVFGCTGWQMSCGRVYQETLDQHKRLGVYRDLGTLYPAF